MLTLRAYPMLALLWLYSVSVAANPQHRNIPEEAADQDKKAVTVSIRQDDSMLRCGMPFYDNFYALTVSVFSVGSGNVDVSDYEQQVFKLIRSSMQFEGFADEFVEHVKDIPGQLVKIIQQDPQVLDSCSNFSIALLGPP
ncbi:MAG: hypothetical protein COC19_06010 [SAR86 cluster bacterium]|uniref:Uncharacterized protein n=1 Tax=SAR86 cluster bacterium TaxID=2030880 RepID=A0A2A4MJT2_9GAMM|nr:MAG: hypothetical protein COC19_06010 [SAR86 cluster bacterium]